MIEKLNRREVLGALAGASLTGLRLHSAEARGNKIEFFASSLDERALEEQKMKAVTTLVSGFWEHPKVHDYVTAHYFGGTREQGEVRQKLREESRMFIPTSEICTATLEKYAAHFRKLAQEMPKGKYGIFIDGDKQTLYLLKRIVQREVQFIKGYPVSTSREEWSNDPHSGGTPIGLHRIAEERKGMLGEIVAASRPNGSDYTRLNVEVDGKPLQKLFVKSLAGGDDVAAEMITDRFLIVGPTTPASRAINIHGTNRTDLLGTRGSGGCIRMSNVDITDLSAYVEVGTSIRTKKGVGVKGSTPVMIQASWQASTDSQLRKKEKRDGVPYRPRGNPWDEFLNN